MRSSSTTIQIIPPLISRSLKACSLPEFSPPIRKQQNIRTLSLFILSPIVCKRNRPQNPRIGKKGSTAALAKVVLDEIVTSRAEIPKENSHDAKTVRTTRKGNPETKI